MTIYRAQVPLLHPRRWSPWSQRMARDCTRARARRVARTPNTCRATCRLTCTGYKRARARFTGYKRARARYTDYKRHYVDARVISAVYVRVACDKVIDAQ